MAQGVSVKTVKPDLRGLELVIYAAHQLHGDRHAPELPIPRSVIDRYAAGYGFSSAFGRLVAHYDMCVLNAANQSDREERAQMDAQMRKTKAKGRR